MAEDKGTLYTEEQINKIKENATAEASKNLFNQDAVNSFVKKEKDKIMLKFADYDTMKTEAAKVADLVLKQTQQDAKLMKNNQQITSIYDNLFSKIPESKQSLIPGDWSTTEKLDYIQKNESNLINVEEKFAPKTPPKEGFEKKTPTDFGGYSNLTEWAQKDPKDYAEKNNISR